MSPICCKTLVPTKQIIINLYSQYRYGKDKCYTDYAAFQKGLTSIVKWLEARDNPRPVIGIPYGIGSGLAGGNWYSINNIIKAVFEPSQFKVLICKLPDKKIKYVKTIDL